MSAMLGFFVGIWVALGLLLMFYKLQDWRSDRRFRIHMNNMIAGDAAEARRFGELVRAEIERSMSMGRMF